MNKIILLGILIVSLCYGLTVYTVDTDRSGFSAVTLSIEGNENPSIILPQDAGNFKIAGGSYMIENSTAIITAGKSGFTTFSFTTSLFTNKISAGWKIMFLAPTQSDVHVYLPPYSTMQSSYPQPKTISAQTSRTIVEFNDTGEITIYYKLDQPTQQTSDPNYIIIAVILALAIIIGAFIIRAIPTGKPKEEKQTIKSIEEKLLTLEITSGKKEMMETFNDNDLKIVNVIFSSNGKIRRNELERKSCVSKSSLAMALNRLEKRKIIEIDRSATTHFVKFSDYFLKL